MIKKLLSEGKTFEFIRGLIGVSNGLITNVKNFSPNVETRAKRKKTSARQDNLIIRTVKKPPFITSIQMKNELDLPIDTSTISYSMIEANLRARRPRKVPMLKTVHMKNRLQFAKNL